MPEVWRCGHRLSASNEGAGRNHLLEITLPDDCCDLPYFELVEEGKPYRKWCIPAEIINRYGTVRFATSDEENVSNIRIT
jgi:hypothetical protein